jgi:hypothetical protein
MLHFVSSLQTINHFKKSRHFIQSLGLVATIEKNGRRAFNDKDSFAYHYNSQYKTTIYGQGSVGNIKFYTDHYITDNSFAVYYGDTFEEFIFKIDLDIIKEKGIDFYIGHIIKNVDLEYQERKKNDEIKKMEQKPEGNPDMVFQNPGAVTYADIKAYLDKKNKERYKT